MSFKASNLKKKERYEFWVTASTIIGEGQPSKSVTQSPSTRGKTSVFHCLIDMFEIITSDKIKDCL